MSVRCLLIEKRDILVLVSQNMSTVCAGIESKLTAQRIPRVKQSITTTAQPLILYHGTCQSTVFDPSFRSRNSGNKIFFSTSLPIARKFAKKTCHDMMMSEVPVVHRYKTKKALGEFLDLDVAAAAADASDEKSSSSGKLSKLHALGVGVYGLKQTDVNQDTIPLCDDGCVPGWKFLYLEKQVVVCPHAFAEHLQWDGVSHGEWPYASGSWSDFDQSIPASRYTWPFHPDYPVSRVLSLQATGTSSSSSQAQTTMTVQVKKPQARSRVPLEATDKQNIWFDDLAVEKKQPFDSLPSEVNEREKTRGEKRQRDKAKAGDFEERFGVRERPRFRIKTLLTVFVI